MSGVTYPIVAGGRASVLKGSKPVATLARQGTKKGKLRYQIRSLVLRTVNTPKHMWRGRYTVILCTRGHDPSEGPVGQRRESVRCPSLARSTCPLALAYPRGPYLKCSSVRCVSDVNGPFPAGPVFVQSPPLTSPDGEVRGGTKSLVSEYAELDRSDKSDSFACCHFPRLQHFPRNQGLLGTPTTSWSLSTVSISDPWPIEVFPVEAAFVTPAYVRAFSVTPSSSV